jgi:23S rRNA (adenine2030-N6)-methyltransferase
MLSYRHAFHAGNHADVLKHLVLVQLLNYLNQKDKPYWVVDSHAGAGCYALDAGYALKNREYESGISRLWSRQDIPAAVAEYVELVRGFNANGKLKRYPGSPWFAMHLMREADRLRLFELHSSDVELLKKEFARNFAGDERRYAIADSDGFASLKSVLPPPPRRGLVLIDPAYEDKHDYLHVIAAAKDGLARFAGGTYALWIPQLTRSAPRQLIEKLQKLPADWLHVRLTVRAPAEDGFGMHGSSMFVINPPWTLAATLGQVMPWLVAALACDDSAGFVLEQGSAAAPHLPPLRRAPVHGRP